MGTLSLVIPWTSLDITLTEQSLVLLAHESMFLLGSKAAAAPASLDEDNPTFTCTSSSAVEQSILVTKPTSLECDVQRESKILTPVLYICSLVHCTTVWTINQLKNVTTEHSLCLVWVSKTQDTPAQDYSEDMNAGSQSFAAKVRILIRFERETQHKPSQKASIY